MPGTDEGTGEGEERTDRLGRPVGEDGDRIGE